MSRRAVHRGLACARAGKSARFDLFISFFLLVCSDVTLCLFCFFFIVTTMLLLESSPSADQGVFDYLK